jgi:hypothetical protein
MQVLLNQNVRRALRGETIALRTAAFYHFSVIERPSIIAFSSACRGS